MALYDHRVFRYERQWWVAQVHGASGAGWGDTPPRPTRDSVFFTCLSSEDQRSRTASIPAGWLNRLSHSSLLKLLQAAKEYGDRLPMEPYNAPSRDELGAGKLADDEGLEWTFRQVQAVRADANGRPQHVPAVELICLDDSALRKEVLLQDSDTLDNLLRTHGTAGVGELIIAVKSTFREYEPDSR